MLSVQREVLPLKRHPLITSIRADQNTNDDETVEDVSRIMRVRFINKYAESLLSCVEKRQDRVGLDIRK